MLSRFDNPLLPPLGHAGWMRPRHAVSFKGKTADQDIPHLQKLRFAGQSTKNRAKSSGFMHRFRAKTRAILTLLCKDSNVGPDLFPGCAT